MRGDDRIYKDRYVTAVRAQRITEEPEATPSEVEAAAEAYENNDVGASPMSEPPEGPRLPEQGGEGRARLAERRWIMGAKWNYEGASAERCDVIVPEWREGDPPLAWWKPLSGVTVKAVLVRYYDQRHLLFDGDGSATNKVTHGGGPDMPSKSLPMRAWRAVNPGD